MKTIVGAIFILWLVCSVSFSFGQCTANAGASIEICAGDSVVLGGSPTGTGDGELSYSWNNGADPVANPVVFPTVTTNYEVTVTDANECTASDNMTVTVLPAPEVTIDFSQPDDCSTTAVQFLSTVNNCDNCSYAWHFGNDASGPANTSSAPNPNHIFVSTGTGEETFTVSLTVTSANGCTTTTTTEVVGQQSPEAELTEELNFTQCQGYDNFITEVTDASTTGANSNFHIDWGDGSPPYDSNFPPNEFQHTYTGINIWTLTYTVTGSNGCSDIVTYEVSNITNPAIGAATQGNNSQCGPVEMCFVLSEFIGNHESTDYIVSFGDGSPPEIFSHPPPTLVCHTYTVSSCPESYTFSIEANNNCTPSIVTISPIQIFSAPQAQFVNPSSVCVNTDVLFQNLSYGGYDQNCSDNADFLWDFGDPASGSDNTSTAEDGIHSYSSPGVYTITLTATNGGNPQASCGSTSYQQTICVEPPPEPNFSIPLVGCVPFAAGTSNNSTINSECDITTYWEVEYEDMPCAPNSGAFQYSGGTGQGSDEPQFSFQSAGEYTVELNLSNSCGTFSDSKAVTVNTIPTVEIDPIENICPEEAISPTAVVDGCNTPISNYSWSFPGGSPASSNAATPGSITYNTAGTYTIELTITNDCGTATATKTFIVEDPAEINLTASEETLCFGQSTELMASGADSYVWESAPGLVPNGANATASPLTTTTYTVTGFTSAGCSASTDITIAVNPLSEVNIPVPENICSGESVVLNPIISGGSTPYTSFQWTPADGLSQTNVQNPIASPLTSTEYTLVVTDSEGCEETAVVSVTVDPLPIVEAGPDITLCNQPVPELLTGFSPTTGGTGVWTGTGITNTATGEFTPNGVGSYTLTYTFTSSATGCEASDELTVSVIEPQIVDAGPDLAMCQNSPQVQLEAGTPGGVWSGEGVTPGGIFSPETVQTYTLTYSIGGGSCLTFDEVEIVVHPLPVVNAGSDVAICAGESIDLNGSVVGGSTPYSTIIWNPGDFLSETDVLNPIATPPVSHTYTLTISDANNCESSDDVIVNINPLPEVDAGDDLILCDQPQEVLLEGYNPVGGTWSGDGITNSNTGEFTPNGEGTFPVIYEYSDGNGCTSSDEIIITVTGLTQADAGADLEMCLNSDAVQLAEEGIWSGNHITSDGLFTPEEAGIFTLTYTTGTGTCQTFDEIEVTVWELPVADAGSDQVICFADTLQVLGTGSSSNPPITSMVWSGDLLEDDGAGTMTVSPEVLSTYALTVTDSEGCIASDEMTVSVNQLPVIDAGPDVVLCNQPIAFNFEEANPPGGEWTGNGITNSAEGEFTPNGEGNYLVTYTFSNANGCTNSDSLIVQVEEPVIVDAGADVTLCLNEPPYSLTDFVPSTGGNWSGDGIADGSTGIFDAGIAGVGEHVLTLQNGAGTCYSEDQILVTVLGLPVVDAGIDEAFCGNDGVVQLSTFTPAGGTWLGTGIIDASQGTFDTGIGSGSYDLYYGYTDPVTGCADTIVKTVAVSPLPVPGFWVNPEACTNSPLEVDNTTPGANSYLWDFGNGDTSTDIDPDYTYPTPGNYTITLTATNEFGCIEEISYSAEAIHPPVADFILPITEGCAPLEVLFENTSQGDYVEYFWNFSTGTSSEYEPAPVIYQQGDSTLIYPVVLTATNYCGSHTASSEVTVFPTPQVFFATDVDIFCSPYSVSFNNLTVGEPTSFLWEFGDGSTANTFNVPPHLYTTDDEPTDYTITLSASNDCGTDFQDYTITVLPNTVTAFFNTDITFGCAPLEVNFTNYSSGATEYYYSFGDAVNSGSNDASPTFTFTEPGIYTTQLFADNGCSYDTASVQIEVFETPVLTFTTEENYCFGETVQFINTSFDSDYFTWDFGDGNSSTETSPAHTYEAPGFYNVTLAGQSLEDECPGFGEQTIEIFAAPEPSFEVPDQVGCSPFTVQFSNTTSGGNFYEWNFGEGNMAGIENPVHTFYNETGETVSYPVTLTAINTALCEADYSFNIIVSPTPISDFVLSGNESCDHPFVIESANLSQFANNYEWSWPEGSSSTLAPEMSFSESGMHEVSLTASNSFGCSDTAFQSVTVFPKPVILFEPTVAQSCPPLSTQFINQTTDADNYFWTFSSGDTSFAVSPSIWLTEPGNYHARLVASNEFGCTDTLLYENVVTVFPVPAAGFSWTPENPTSQDLTLEFQNQTIGGYNYYWSTSEGQTSTLQDPTFEFPDGGTYTVQLRAQNIYGCIDYTSQQVIIPQDFFIYVPNAFTPDQDGLNEEFKPIVGGSNILNYTFQVFDRWGELLFETNNRNEAWIGDVRSGDYYVKEEVYVWQVLVRYLSNGDVQTERIRGHVTVLR